MERQTLIPTYSMTLTPSGLHIEGHRGIGQYSQGTITVKTKSKLITVTGRRLTLGAMTKTEIFITGVIQDIRIDDRGRHT